MRSANYLALACAVVLALLVAASCGGGDGQTVRSVGPQASPIEPPFGPTPMPMSQNEALWDWIASNSPEVEPVLRPTYLPSNLTQMTVGMLDQRLGCVLFVIRYSDSAGTTRLAISGGPSYNLPLPGPGAAQEPLDVRQTTGTYQLQDAAEPLALAFLTWHEPGRWGRPGDDWHRDYVEYLISGEGFSKEELLMVANSLQPVTQ